MRHTSDIVYKMWNRLVSGSIVEVSLYNADWTRINSVQLENRQAEALPGKWVSPMEVYGKTNGTMGLTPEAT